MLILSRKQGQRVRIKLPDQSCMWLTMRSGFVEVVHGQDIRVLKDNLVSGEIGMVFIPRRHEKHQDSIGITAPQEYKIHREELLQ